MCIRDRYQRNRELFRAAPDQMPVYGTIAARFNDDGVTALYQAVVAKLVTKGLKIEPGILPPVDSKQSSAQGAIVPPARARYLADIAESVRGYHKWAQRQSHVARERQQLRSVLT